MKNFAIIIAAAVAFTACGGGTSTSGDGVIDVEHALENLTPITTSMLGSNIRYVPLETGDSVLVGGKWTLYATDDKVVVNNAGNVHFNEVASVMSFDINSGRFIASIGRQGVGPEEYLAPFPTINYNGESVYFMAGNGKGWVEYDLEGNFKGKILPEMPFEGNRLSFVKDTVATFVNSRCDESNRRTVVSRYGVSGVFIDSMVQFDGQYREPYQLRFGGRVSIATYDKPFPNSHHTIPIITCNGKETLLAAGGAFRVGDEVFYEETLCDTLYRLTADGFVPSLIFNMGSNGFPFSEINKRPVQPSEYIIVDHMGTQSSLLFGMSQGYPNDDNSNTYIGLYDRATGKTTLGAGIDGIRDDLSGFMPFNPVTVTPSGKFIGVLTMEAIDEWMDEHPDATLPDALKGYSIDDNPVLVIID